jgi:N-acetylneuraminic acid mutarotase
VLVMGGHDRGVPVTTVEIFDPHAGAWGPAPGMATNRYYFTATTLEDGKILVAGGCSKQYCQKVTSVAELFDPSTGTWTITGRMRVARDYHTATRLADGRVLITGGYSTKGTEGRTEIYDPATGSWSTGGRLATPRSLHEAAHLPTGQVLVAGGQAANGAFLRDAEVYTPGTNRWTSAGTMADFRQYFTMSQLNDGTLLVGAGWTFVDYNHFEIPRAEVYDPLSSAWSATDSLNEARAQHRAVVLPDGRVLVAGGVGNDGYRASAELYTP